MSLTYEQIYIFIVLAVTLVLFAWGRWRYDLVAMLAMIAAVLGGLVDSDAAFSGFAHPAVITVAAVLVLSKGLQNAGVVDMLARGLSRVGDRPFIQLVTLTSLVAVCSAFMNNVGALALLIPVAVWMARDGGYSQSRLLMPLAFGSLLGGMMTLIGTPPNIIVSTFRAQTDGIPFGMFAFSPVGVGVTVAGVSVICTLARWVVPERTSTDGKDKMFSIDEYLSEVVVPSGSKKVGETLHALEGGLGDDAEVTVVGLVRKDKKQWAPSPYTVLRQDDILIVEAAPEDLKTFLDTTELTLAESMDEEGDLLESKDVQLQEAVVIQNSPLIGKTAELLELRQQFGVNLLAVARRGKRLRERLSHIRLALGDILLLQGGRDSLAKSLRELQCLPLAERGLDLARPRNVVLAAGIFGAGILATTTGFLAVQVALATAAVVMILVGLISLRETYDAIDWPVVVLLAAMMPVGAAFESTGAAQLFADQVSAMAQGRDPRWVLPILLVATCLLSNVVNNAAAALLMAPIALNVAQALDVSADPLLMGVAVGASSAFLTPIGHQSNTLVMQPGGYHFGDYWRLGLPVTAAVLAVGTIMILWFWPL